MMMRSVFKPLREKWNNEKVGVKMRTNEGQREECRVSHMIFADNCYLFFASREEIRKMRGLDWKEDQTELMASGFGEEVGRCAL